MDVTTPEYDYSKFKNYHAYVTLRRHFPKFTWWKGDDGRVAHKHWPRRTNGAPYSLTDLLAHCDGTRPLTDFRSEPDTTKTAPSKPTARVRRPRGYEETDILHPYAIPL